MLPRKTPNQTKIVFILSALQLLLLRASAQCPPKARLASVSCYCQIAATYYDDTDSEMVEIYCTNANVVDVLQVVRQHVGISQALALLFEKSSGFRSPGLSMHGLLLRRLVLYQNGIRLIDENNLRGLAPNALRSLEMQEPMLEQIAPAAIQNSMPQLATLRISSSHRLRSFPRLETLQELIRLELVNSSLNSIPNTPSLPASLTHLDLSSNLLQDIPYDAFSNLQRLQLLRLSKNKFASKPQRLFSALERMRYLRFLYLDDNLISALPEGVLNNFENLLILDASNNKINILRTLFTQNSRSSLRELYLAGNMINNILPNAFANLTRLQTLNLDNNR